MNPDIDEDHDVILFPFLFSELSGDLQSEAGAYAFAGLNSWDWSDGPTEAERHNWGDSGRLIIYGHGSDAVDKSQFLYGSHDKSVTPDALARMIRQLGFPRGADHEIIVWSCHSGPVGRFAQQLALHLINEGYTGKKVWGCNRFGGTIDRGLKCLKAADRTDRAPHRATEADSSFYIGVGEPLDLSE